MRVAAWVLVLFGCQGPDVEEEVSVDALVEEPGCQLPAIQNGGFETGTLAGWRATGRSAIVATAHSGNYAAQVGGQRAKVATLRQGIVVPPASATLSFAYSASCSSSGNNRAELVGKGGRVVATLFDGCVTNSDWTEVSFDLSPYAGLALEVVFSANGGPFAASTFLVVDDVRIDIAPPIVTIDEPLGPMVSLPAQITVSATAHPCTTITRIELTIDGGLQDVSSSSPLIHPWTFASPGQHRVVATAFDARGRMSTTERVYDVPQTGCQSFALWRFSGAAPVASLTPMVHPLSVDAVGNQTIHAVFGAGSQLHMLDARSGALIAAPFLGANVSAPLAAAPLSDGQNYLFTATENGMLHRVRLSGSPTASSRSVRRPNCSSDSVEAAPAVQLAAYSNSGFVLGTDVVFVGTSYGCDDHSSNKVFALNAGSINQAFWIFNEFNEYQIDEITGCMIDYDANRLYCAARALPGRVQFTLFALDTNTGAPVFVRTLGSIRSTPVMNWNTRTLYVATEDGVLHAIDPDDPTEPGRTLWSEQIHFSGSLSRVSLPLFAEFRAPYQDMIFVVDDFGVLHALWDGGTGGFELWSAQIEASTQVATIPSEGRLFVGTQNGQLLQLDMSTGSLLASRTITENGVTGVSLFYDASAPMPWRVGATGSTSDPSAKVFCAPFAYGTTGL